MKETIQPNKIGDTLTVEQLAELESLAGLDFTVEELASYLGVDEMQFRVEYQTKGSIISRTAAHGKLVVQATLGLTLLNKAKEGDIKALSLFYDAKRDRSFESSKLDVFGAFESDEALHNINDYIEKGASGSLSEREQSYLDLLIMVSSLDAKYGKRKTIKYLTSEPFKMSYERASSVYSESTEFFFAQRSASKQALRAKFADRLDSLYIAARDNASTPRDYEVAAGILTSAAKILRLDQEDVEKLPKEQYTKPVRLLSLTPESIGLEPANRDALARQIEGLTVSDSEKVRLRREADIEDIDIIEMLEDVTQEDY